MGLIAFLLVAVLVLLVVFIAKVSNLSGKLTNADWELRKLRGRVDDLEQGMRPPGKKPKEAVSPPQWAAPQKVLQRPLADSRGEPTPARQISGRLHG